MPEFVKKSRVFGLEKSGEIAPAENHATETLPKISDTRSLCLLVNFSIKTISSAPQSPP